MKSIYYFTLLLIFRKQCDFSFAKAIIGQNIIEASELQFPFIVSISKYEKIMIPNDHLCTGSLISRKHVLTCAHCKNDKDVQSFRVIVGSSNLRRGAKHKLKDWVSYLQWIFKNNNYIKSMITDISIITLCTFVNIPGFEPVKISNTKIQHLYGTDVLMAGWSYVNNTAVNDYLKYGYLKILTPTECQRKVTNCEVSETLMCSVANPYLLLNYINLVLMALLITEHLFKN